MVYEEYSGVGKQYVRGFAGNNRSRTSIKPLRHSTGSFFASIMVDGLHSSSILYLLASFPSLSNKAQLRAMASVSPSSNEGEIAR